jgi:hypothetical protein
MMIDGSAPDSLSHSMGLPILLSRTATRLTTSRRPSSTTRASSPSRSRRLC